MRRSMPTGGAANRRRPGLRALGAAAVTFHDDDLLPDESARESTLERFEKALAETGLEVEMVTVLEPLVGFTTVPNARSEFFVSVIGWTILTVALVDCVAEVWAMAGAATAAITTAASAVRRLKNINDPFCGSGWRGRGAGVGFLCRNRHLLEQRYPRTPFVEQHTSI